MRCSWSYPCLPIPRLALIVLIIGASPLKGQNAPPDPEQMFRQLDANQDGSITLEEQRGPGGRQFAQRVFEMAKKPAAGSISKDEFLRIAEQHQGGGRGQPGGGPNGGPGRGGPGFNGGPGRTGGSNRGPGAGPEQNGRPPRNDPGRPDFDSGEMPPGMPPFLRGIDENKDQRFSRSELQRLIDRFDELDKNQDGDLDLPELDAFSSTRNANSRESNTDATESKQNVGKNSTSTPSKPGKNGPATGRGTGNRSPSNKSASTEGSRNSQGSLAGVWRGWVVDGRGENPDTGHMEMELTVNGNHMSARELGANQRAREGLGEGTFIASVQGTTGNLDATQTVGQHAGREYRGIFEVNGDTLKWCVGGRGTTRPSEFATSRGNYYMILHRQQ